MEKEFHHAISYSMHKPSSKIDISKEKLTKHFQNRSSERVLELPPELANPNNYEYLKDTPIGRGESKGKKKFLCFCFLKVAKIYPDHRETKNKGLWDC